MTPPGEAPKEWFIGQQTPATYTSKGMVDKWRLVQVGEQCPWDNRVATCVKQERKDNRANWAG
eukprot:13108965-Heterocapsa_arctica.AAC.1